MEVIVKNKIKYNNKRSRMNIVYKKKKRIKE